MTDDCQLILRVDVHRVSVYCRGGPVRVVGESMPLNEREEKILEEIERNLYAEDPKLAQTVAKTSLTARTKRRGRLAVVGFVAGLVIMLGTFTTLWYLAGLGFILMVVSGATLVIGYRASAAGRSGPSSFVDWMDDLRQRLRRER